MEGDPKNIKGAARITALNVSRPEVWGRPYILKAEAHLIILVRTASITELVHYW
jgi:hypothetical protein